jgi:hypothetical protein
MFSINLILEVNTFINISIIESKDIGNNRIDVITMPSSWTNFWNDNCYITVKRFTIWTIFSSPNIFDFNETNLDFHSINLSISVKITMFSNISSNSWIHFVTNINLTISIGIHVSHNIPDFFINIKTVHGTSTGTWFIVTVTMNVWITISDTTLIFSPSIFSVNDAGMDFTEINSTIKISITLFNK